VLPRKIRWYFGSGFDLRHAYDSTRTACIGTQARAACEPFGANLYPNSNVHVTNISICRIAAKRFGIGGIFFDDWSRDSFANSFAFARSVGDHLLPAYTPIFRTAYAAAPLH
jgi:coproporphyrinogen III oxidase